MLTRHRRFHLLTLLVPSVVFLCFNLEAQTTDPIAQQNHNRQVIGNLIAARSDARAMIPMHLSQRLQEVTQITEMKEKASKLSDAGAIQSLNTQIQTMQLHLDQELRTAPVLADTTPDPLVPAAMNGPSPSLNHILLWNKAALDLTSIDFTAAPDGHPELHPEFGEELGPPCTSRAMAIVHLAMFEAINTIERKYHSYQDPAKAGTIQAAIFASTKLTPAQVSPLTADENSAIEAAALRTLAALYPHKTGYLQAVFAGPDTTTILARLQMPIGSETAAQATTRAAAQIALGLKIGEAAADAVLADRYHDGSEPKNADGTPMQDPSGTPLCYVGGTVTNGVVTPGPASHFPLPVQYLWTRDPLHPTVDTALGSTWGSVNGFTFTKVDDFKAPAPPAPDSDEFKRTFELTRLVGGAEASTLRTPEQTDIGIFWAYDGTPGLCAPPRLYNMIVTSIATKEKPVTDGIEMARLLALTNIAMADAGVASWSGKYYYQLARPVTAIRDTKIGSSYPYASWAPLGAQVTNTRMVNFTPPFPTYPSGHATFGGALFQVLRRFWGTDTADSGTAFNFVSDEYNGLSLDPITGVYRPASERRFNSLAQAESENAMSRVYLGIHWKIDADAGIQQGNAVGNHVYDQLFAKLP